MAEPINWIKKYQKGYIVERQDKTKVYANKYRKIKEDKGERDLQGELIDDSGKPSTDTRTAAQRNHDYLNNPFNKEQLTNRLTEIGDMVSPMAIAGMGALAGTALVASPGAFAGSVVGGEATNLATDRISKGKYGTWGQMVSDKTGLSRTLSEFTNPGAIIGGATPSAYQYGNGYVAGGKQATANNFMLAEDDISPITNEVYDKLSNIRKIYATVSTGEPVNKVANLIKSSNLSKEELSALLENAKNAGAEYGVSDKIRTLDGMNLQPKPHTGKLNLFAPIPEEVEVAKQAFIIDNQKPFTMFERGYGRSFNKKQNAADIVNKKNFDENVIPFKQPELEEVDSDGLSWPESHESLIPSLFRVNDSDTNGAINKAIWELQNTKPKGTYVSSGSLSTDSYVATTSNMSKVSKDPNFSIHAGNEMGLNGMDDFTKLGISPKYQTMYINKHLARINVNGKKFPAARFAPDYPSAIVPEMVITKHNNPTKFASLHPEGSEENLAERLTWHLDRGEREQSDMVADQLEAIQRARYNLYRQQPANSLENTMSRMTSELTSTPPHLQEQYYNENVWPRIEHVLEATRRGHMTQQEAATELDFYNEIGNHVIGNRNPRFEYTPNDLPPQPIEMNQIWKKGGQIDYINNFKLKTKWQRK